MVSSRTCQKRVPSQISPSPLSVVTSVNLQKSFQVSSGVGMGHEICMKSHRQGLYHSRLTPDPEFPKVGDIYCSDQPMMSLHCRRHTLFYTDVQYLTTIYNPPKMIMASEEARESLRLSVQIMARFSATYYSTQGRFPTSFFNHNRDHSDINTPSFHDSLLVYCHH